MLYLINNGNSKYEENRMKSLNNWYVLKTKSNFERKVLEKLESIGIEGFLPMYETIRVWSDRKKRIEVPLLPSYVFFKCSEADIQEAVKVNGVAWLVNDFGKPAIVKNYEIENLKIFIQDKTSDNVDDLEDYTIGESVRVTHGSFQGIIGKLVHNQGDFRVLLEIESIGSSFLINVPKSQVIPELKSIDKTP